mmetsp:Transcript_8560/g.7591  ORF Transcript_8560/g.7591 Transcript_8560/m.7591 type:complete len:165 (+) Transcript_8560:236-730(+)
MMTFHSNSHLRVKRNDSVPVKMDSWAWDCLVEEKYYEEGEGSNPTEDNNSVLFTIQHRHVNGVSYGLYNYDNRDKKVNINMNKTSEAYFSPKYGIKEKTIGPKSIEYLCSALADPHFEDGDESEIDLDYLLDIEDGEEYSEEDSEEDEVSDNNSNEESSEESKE